MVTLTNFRWIAIHDKGNKSSHILRRPQKFEKISHLFWDQWVKTAFLLKQVEGFFSILWPSDNVLTLSKLKTNNTVNQNQEVYLESFRAKLTFFKSNQHNKLMTINHFLKDYSTKAKSMRYYLKHKQKTKTN